MALLLLSFVSRSGLTTWALYSQFWGKQSDLFVRSTILGGDIWCSRNRSFPSIDPWGTPLSFYRGGFSTFVGLLQIWQLTSGGKSIVFTVKVLILQFRTTLLKVKIWNWKCTWVKVQKYRHQTVLFFPTTPLVNC